MRYATHRQAGRSFFWRIPLFDRFWRGDRARVRSGGSRPGLAIAKQIVEAHGGEIMVESLPGEGTTIRLHVPVFHDG